MLREKIALFIKIFKIYDHYFYLFISRIARDTLNNGIALDQVQFIWFLRWIFWLN